MLPRFYLLAGKGEAGQSCFPSSPGIRTVSLRSVGVVRRVGGGNLHPGVIRLVTGVLPGGERGEERIVGANVRKRER